MRVMELSHLDVMRMSPHVPLKIQLRKLLNDHGFVFMNDGLPSSADLSVGLVPAADLFITYDHERKVWRFEQKIE